MLYTKKVNLGILEALKDIEMPLDTWLLAVGIKYPLIYFKFVGYYNSPAGQEITIEAISEDEAALIKFEAEMCIDKCAEAKNAAEDTYNYDFNDEVYNLVFPEKRILK